MKKVNHECYVDLEVAELLKQAEFDWGCHCAYTTEYGFRNVLLDTYGWDYGYVDWNNTDSKKLAIYGIVSWGDTISAPTLDVAQRWLREVKDIHLFVRPILRAEHTYVTTIVVDDSTWGQVNDRNGNAIIFDSYEEAQEAGIKKALELILEKGK